MIRSSAEAELHALDLSVISITDRSKACTSASAEDRITRMPSPSE